MNLKNNKLLKSGAFICAVCLVIFACKEKYMPSVNDANPNYLVIDGFINTGGDSTIITVSRTFKLDGKAVLTGEKGAMVMVENDGGAVFNLTEILLKPGTYAIPTIGTDQTKKYRLRVRTKNNNEYVSDFVECKTSPSIDNVSLDFRNGNLNIYANSHDATGNSRYYNYSYVETWQYRANLYTPLKLENREIKLRKFPEDDIYNCWHNRASSNITLGSTVNLSQDVIADKLLISAPITSSKFALRYSILVKQVVLTKAGFEFWENMKKNNEQVGSVFDSQPSQLFGNIHSTNNPAEKVIGFISAGSVAQKRLTFSQTDFPFIPGRYIDPVCELSMDSLYYASPSGDQVKFYITDPFNPVHLPVAEIISDGIVIGYSTTTAAECVDCRKQGGTNVKPSYW